MKLVFLHGLGQSAESWKEVRNLLTDYPSEAIELFPSSLSTPSSRDRTFCFGWIVLRCFPGTRTFQLRFTKSPSFGSIRMPT